MSPRGEQAEERSTVGALLSKIGEAFAALHDSTVAVTAGDYIEAHDRLLTARGRSDQALTLSLSLRAEAEAAAERAQAACVAVEVDR